MSHSFVALFVLLATVAIGCGNGSGSGSDPEPDAGDDSGPQELYDAGISWIAIEPGELDMGSPLNEWSRGLNERLHHVSLIHSYEIASTEVTLVQWQSLEVPLAWGENTGCTADDCPVAGESVGAIRGWLDELSTLSGLEPCYAPETVLTSPYHCRGYRLPTEAEWERAARAGDQRATYAGDLTEENWSEVLADIGNCAGGAVAPAGSLLPNDLGLYDVLGNLAELTDWSGTYPVGPVDNPHGDLSGEHVGQRGGSYSSSHKDCRAASRTRHTVDPGAFPVSTGFRPVRTLPGSALPDGPYEPSPCPGPATYSCAGEDPAELPGLLSTSDIGAGAEFVAGDYHSSAMALVGDATFDELLVPFMALVTRYSVVSPEVVEWIAQGPAGHSAVDVKVWNDCDEDSEYGIALLSDGEAFQLAQPSADFTTLDLLAAGVVPDGLDPTALDGPRDAPYPIYVVGDGIASFNGVEWFVHISPGTGGRFLEVNYLHPYAPVRALAVGEEGRVAALLDGGWVEVDSGTTSGLLSADLWDDGERVFIGGSAGAMLFGPIDDLIVCDLEAGAVTGLFVPPEYDGRRSFYAGLDAGQTLKWMPESSAVPICFVEPAPGPALEVAWDWHKAYYRTEVVLTAEGLYGYFW